MRPLGCHADCTPAPPNHHLPAREPRNEEDGGSAKRTQCSGGTPAVCGVFSLQAVGLGTQRGARRDCAGDERLTSEGLGDPLRLDMAGLPFVRHSAGVGVAHKLVSPQSLSFTERR